jgi:glucose-6-phosphate 1-dehydrogenase
VYSKGMNPAMLVIFGITGDLARRKLLPGLYNLARYDLLPKPFRIVGVTRSGLGMEELLGKIKQGVEASGETCDQTTLERLSQLFEIHTMDLLDLEAYRQLGERLDAIETEAGMCLNRLFYLAIPSQTFTPVVELLGKSGLNKTCQHDVPVRLLIEKPFGYDLESAHELINELAKYFTEDQLYRIDHYLAKETAQNILVFRFQNPLFKLVWHRDCVKAIMLTAAETIDIEGRSTFYEQTGALRDFVQSHLLQLLALTTMEEPAKLEAGAIHEQKLALLQAITPIAPDKVASQAIRGQYQGYPGEVQNPHSTVETYAALRLEINNDRWRGVPVLLRTGKALADKVVEITLLFTDDSDISIDNTLTIRIQPNEGIALQLLAKKPGLTSEVEPVHMEFCYKRSFMGGNQPDAYERVLIDALRGDKTLFATSDEVLASWRILQNVITEWVKNDTGLLPYAKGSWGPEAADQLAKQAVGLGWPDQTLHICAV